jgi:hypothetical protein
MTFGPDGRAAKNTPKAAFAFGNSDIDDLQRKATGDREVIILGTDKRGSRQLITLREILFADI